MKHSGTIWKTIFGMAALAAFSAVHAGNMAVGDYMGGRIVMVDDQTGAMRGTLAIGGGLTRPLGFAYGPDGLLYVSSYNTGEIKRYNAQGVFVDNYVATPKPHGLAFINGDLVVSNHNVGTISRFGLVSWTSPVNSARWYHSVVIRKGRIFASFAQNGLGGIEEFHPLSGISLGDIIPTSRGLRDVQGFAFSYDNRLFATSSNTAAVFRFDGDTGAPLGSMAVTGGQPIGLRFCGSGDLVTSNWGTQFVVKTSPSTGRFIRNLITSTNGLSQPWYLERVSPVSEARVIFTGWKGTTPPVSTITAKIYYSDTGQLVNTVTATVAANGRVNIPTPQYLTDYDISIKVGKYLTAWQKVDTRDDSLSRPIFNLQNGDLDDNEVIDAADYRTLTARDNSNTSSVGWDATFDLDGNGRVNQDDFSLLQSGYGKSGLRP